MTYDDVQDLPKLDIPGQQGDGGFRLRRMQRAQAVAPVPAAAQLPEAQASNAGRGGKARGVAEPITLTLPYPISANTYWAHRVITPPGKRAMALTHVTHEAKKYREQVGWICRAAGVRAPLEGRVAIEVRLYPQRPLDFATRMRKLGDAWDDGVRCIDLDNANKVLLDSLKGVAILDDGWQVRSLHSDRMEPDGEARVVVTITPIASEPVRQESLL